MKSNIRKKEDRISVHIFYAFYKKTYQGNYNAFYNFILVNDFNHGYCTFTLNVSVTVKV
jgi:hypothetical protein